MGGVGKAFGGLLGGSQGTKSTYSQSPEQRQMYATLLPMIQAMAQKGTYQLGKPGYGMPKADYKLPTAIAPTKQWYDSLSPEIKAGAWAPYEEAANQLGERMGAGGSLGNERGGYSGAAGAAFGDFYADAGNNYGQSLWNMTLPGAQADYNAQLQRSIAGYQGEMNAWALPYGLTGMMPSTFSQGVTSQPPNASTGFGNMLLGGGMGYMMGNQSGSPWLGTGIGALGGLLGGK